MTSTSQPQDGQSWFVGQPVVVTGASSGQGECIAMLMAERGAKVLAVGRDTKKLKAVQERAGSNLIPFAIDLTQDGAPEAVVKAARCKLGGLRVLVQSAGLFDPVSFVESDARTLDRQWAINVRAPYLLTLAAIPDLRQGGSVVYISSLSAQIGFPGSAAYGATKAAVEMMMKCLAAELGPEGIRVNAVAPGWIQTPMNEQILADEPFRRLQTSLVPLRRLGTPRDVAPVVAALASAEFSYVTGVSVRITGGFPVQPMPGSTG